MERELLMGRELPGGKGAIDRKGASRCEESLPVERKLTRWEESSPVGKELPVGKKASWWEDSFPVKSKLPGGKRAYQ